MRKNTKKKKHSWWSVIYGFVLVSFTAYVLLDAFVIPRSYAVVSPSSSAVTQASASQTASASSQAAASASSAVSTSSSQAASQTAVVTDNTYSDGNITITITEYRENNTSIYVADIQVSSVEYLKTAFAQNVFGKNITAKTSSIAASNNAILAVNGDFYGTRNGYVIRNGILYRTTSAGSSQEDLVIYQDGSFGIITEGSISASDLLAQGAWQVLSFGPALVTNGTVSVTQNEEVDQAMTTNPRTAIGIIDSLHYVMVVSDGRTTASTGLSLYQLASFMQGLGVATAYNLDGGGSTTMYFNGTVVNNPTTNGKTITERSVSDIVYIG